MKVLYCFRVKGVSFFLPPQPLTTSVHICAHSGTFEELHLTMVEMEKVNRKRGVAMRRRWVEGKWRKRSQLSHFRVYS